jgi:hypothetical protein
MMELMFLLIKIHSRNRTDAKKADAGFWIYFYDLLFNNRNDACLADAGCCG